MAEVVDAEARQAGTPEPSVEGKGQICHVSRPAIRAGEDQVILLPQFRRLLSLSIEIPTMGFERLEGFGRKGDRAPTAARLGLDEDHSRSTLTLQRAPDVGMSVEQVDVGPPEGQRLTKSDPGRDQKDPKRMVACPGSHSQQAPNLFLAERPHLLTFSTGRLHGVAWIAGD